jgi:hypothetical protein
VSGEERISQSPLRSFGSRSAWLDATACRTDQYAVLRTRRGVGSRGAGFAVGGLYNEVLVSALGKLDV